MYDKMQVPLLPDHDAEIHDGLLAIAAHDGRLATVTPYVGLPLQQVSSFFSLQDTLILSRCEDGL